MRASETSREQILPLSTDPGLRKRFQVASEDIPGNFRFGLLLEVLDSIAGEASVGYVHRFLPGARVVTAALDEVVEAVQRRRRGPQRSEARSPLDSLRRRVPRPRAGAGGGDRVEVPACPLFRVASVSLHHQLVRRHRRPPAAHGPAA